MNELICGVTTDTYTFIFRSHFRVSESFVSFTLFTFLYSHSSHSHSYSHSLQTLSPLIPLYLSFSVLSLSVFLPLSLSLPTLTLSFQFNSDGLYGHDCIITILSKHRTYRIIIYITFSHLADAFIQSDLQGCIHILHLH